MSNRQLLSINSTKSNFVPAHKPLVLISLSHSHLHLYNLLSVSSAARDHSKNTSFIPCFRPHIHLDPSRSAATQPIPPTTSISPTLNTFPPLVLVTPEHLDRGGLNPKWCTYPSPEGSAISVVNIKTKIRLRMVRVPMAMDDRALPDWGAATTIAQLPWSSRNH